MKNKAVEKWANQEIILKVKMKDLSDLMDILFIADTPFNFKEESFFKNTLKLNNLIKPFYNWQHRVEKLVCRDEIKEIKVNTKKLHGKQ